MKKLSVIIVSYNVSHFLEQALVSVQKAIRHVDAEVLVIDNRSVDGSAKMVAEKFPEVILVANADNVGFSKANNQGMKMAKGEYVLLLNPDTVVEEDSLKLCCDFMDGHPQAGALGVKMVDGSGRYLPESKRGQPTLSTSLYKISGIYKLFPESPKFNHYYQGHLSPDEVHEVDLLAGAFMLLRKKVLDEVGLFDEQFFMYWEDNDLSYRIAQAGHKNYYFPKTRIIHYKGESSRKQDARFVFIFYRSMLQYIRKHYPKDRAFYQLVKAAMYLKAGAYAARDFLVKIGLPVLDTLFIFLGMYLLKTFWETEIKSMPGFFPDALIQVAIPLYILTWLVTVYFSGGYDRPHSSYRMVRGVIFGTIIISGVTNFFTDYRFSRALILLGGLYTALWYVFSRFTIHWLRHRSTVLGQVGEKRIVLVGSKDEAVRVIHLLNRSSVRANILGYVSPDANQTTDEFYLGHIGNINDICSLYKVEELIFCLKDITVFEIIEIMTHINARVVEYKIIPEGVDFVVGSQSKERQGSIYAINLRLAILEQNSRRNKRVSDILLALMFILLMPLIIWFVERKGGFIRNIFRVLLGRLSWVGFALGHTDDLPQIRRGVLSPISNLGRDLDQETIKRLDQLYARDYRVGTDLRIIFGAFGNLGNESMAGSANIA